MGDKLVQGFQALLGSSLLNEADSQDDKYGDSNADCIVDVAHHRADYGTAA